MPYFRTHYCAVCAGIGFRITIQNNVREKLFLSLSRTIVAIACVIKILIQDFFLSKIVTLGSIGARGKLYVQLPRVNFELREKMYEHQPELTL